jgi:hypothetical protein
MSGEKDKENGGLRKFVACKDQGKNKKTNKHNFK